MTPETKETLKAIFIRVWPNLSGKKNAALSAVRHSLTGFGGALVAKGFVSSSGAEELVGLASFGVGVLWGALDEYYAEQTDARNTQAIATACKALDDADGDGIPDAIEAARAALDSYQTQNPSPSKTNTTDNENDNHT